MLAIQEAAGDRGQLVMAHAQAAEVAASRGDVAGAASHLTASAELARAVKASERALEWLKPLISSAAYVAYKDGRARDSAVLFGARRGLGPLFVKRFRPILEALEQQGLSDQIAAGSKLSADEALERAVAIVRARPSADLH
jgi:hypothetical protein